jgi:hypothetical protein
MNAGNNGARERISADQIKAWLLRIADHGHGQIGLPPLADQPAEITAGAASLAA